MERSELERLVGVVDALIDEDAGDYYGNRSGSCDQVNGILAQVARYLGYPVVLVRGYVGDEEASHTWVQIGGLHIDLAGAQFGREQVRIFSSDPDYHTVQTVRPGERTLMYPEDEAIALKAIAPLHGKN